MKITLQFFSKENLLKFKKWLDKNNLNYDYENENDDTLIIIYGLNEYDSNFKDNNFYVDFYNENEDFCYIDINVKESGLYSWKIEKE